MISPACAHVVKSRELITGKTAKSVCLRDWWGRTFVAFGLKEWGDSDWDAERVVLCVVAAGFTSLPAVIWDTDDFGEREVVERYRINPEGLTRAFRFKEFIGEYAFKKLVMGLVEEEEFEMGFAVRLLGYLDGTRADLTRRIGEVG